MAIPVIAGIGWLGTLLASAFGTLFTWFVTFMTKRLAIVTAAILVIVALTSALWATIEGSLAALSLALPNEFSAALGMILPSNASTCISIIISAHMLRYAYEWNIRIVQYKLL